MNPKKAAPNSFDFLKLFFASLVVFAHFFVLSEDESLAFLVPFFNITVAIMGFFILSGFLVTTSYFRSRHLYDYFTKRAKRLLPAYGFVVLLSVFFGAVFGSLSLRDYFSNPLVYKYLCVNLVFWNFLQDQLPGLFQNQVIKAVNGSLWTIKIEVAFYIVLPFILYWLEKLKSKTHKNRALISVFIILVFINYYLYHFQQDSIFAQIYLKQLPGKLHFFIVGILGYYNLEYLRSKMPYLAVFGCVLFLEKFVFETDFLWAIGLGALIFFVGFRWVNLKKVLLFGDLSYGVYIYHFLCCQLVFSQYPHVSMSLKLVLVLVCTFSLSLFSWYFIEKRFLKSK